MIYSELVKNAEAIFDGELRLPNNELYETNILSERWAQVRAIKIFDYRCWQLKQMGFQKFELKEIIELMYCQLPDNQYNAKDKNKYEWVYNHHTGRNDRKRWLHQAEYFCRHCCHGFWHWPPYKKEMVWKCKVANLNELSCEVPPGIVLKILRLQTLNLFNVFHVIEPKKSGKKPVLLGTIWELPPQFKQKESPTFDTVGYVGHYFLAEWDDGIIT